MPKSVKMSEAEILTALSRLESQADLADAEQDYRVRAIGAYRGENLRPAPEGRSQVVDRTVWEVCESVKPQLLKLFLSGDEVARFDPRGPEDIDPAETESAAVNFVLTQQNPAFQVFSGWIHDGITLRNGYVRVFWDETDEIESEQYERISDEEFALLVQSDEVTLTEHEEVSEPLIDAMGNILGEQKFHTCEVERRTTKGQARIVNVPPESILVHANHVDVSLARCSFVQHRAKKTISELREMGFDVEDDISDDGDEREEWVNEYRRDYSASTHEDTDAVPDPSMREVLVRESWVRIDKDGDGTASLYRTVVVGKTLLLCEDADHIGIIAWCPIPQPHVHRGFSLYDEVKEIQDVKTALVRSVLDNLYMSNNGRFAVDPDRVNLDDFLVSRPGGMVRTQGDPAGAILPLFQPFNPAPAMQMAEYMDVQRELRTGIPRVQQGQIDPLSQNKTATGISQVFAAGQQRIELIARYFAEGVKELCLVVHQLLSKHSRKPLMMQLNNEFIATDPRQWTKRTDMSISVGLGSGNRFEQTQFLQQILQLMLGPGLQIGLTDPDRVFNALSKLTTAVGYRNPEEFWKKVQPSPQQPPPPDPKLVEVQQRGQMEQAKLQQQAQADQQKFASERELAQMKAQMEAELARYEAELKARTAIEVETIRQQYETQRAAYAPRDMGNSYVS